MVGEKIDEDDKETLEEALKEALDWLDDNQDAEREDYVDKRQELEDTANPIIARMYEKASPDDERGASPALRVIPTAGGECGAPRGEGGRNARCQGYLGRRSSPGTWNFPRSLPPRAPLAPCFHPRAFR